ncbi:MAG: antibiotic biosynthesis monooxygenase [Bacteroidales bacterium]|jgi:quinol monooxygenase YgiN|nr:antibiotic biosynthesis monooxygenase [Bacteroidales bacterium]
MSELKIVAVIKVKKAYKNELMQVFKTVVNETRKEEGNISYDLYEDIRNPLSYTILETWKSQEAIDFHNGSAHFKTFVKDIEGKVDSLTVDVLKKVY